MGEQGVVEAPTPDVAFVDDDLELLKTIVVWQSEVGMAQHATSDIEECLRWESPIKGAFRLAMRDTQLANVDIPMGSIAMAMIGAANRDPRVFEDASSFDAKRQNVRRNLAFGHGEHFCPGASLTRAEARISFERLLARLDDLKLEDPSALSYAPSFLIRGLNDLPLRFRCDS